MAEKLIRIGKVSSVDYEAGMIKVTYPDLDNAVTDSLPVLSLNGEYKMPEVGKEVLVVHLSNGCTAGVVLGPYWNTASKPPESGKGVYRKDFGESPGDAYMRYAEGELLIHAASITLSENAGSTTLAKILNLFNRVGKLEERMGDAEDRLTEVEGKV